MLREIGEALDTITWQMPMLLTLQDLLWVDRQLISARTPESVGLICSGASTTDSETH
jgi:hypothetical protein